MGAAQLLLVRHGEVEGIRPARFRGRRDVPLSAEGLRHARATGERLAKGPRPDALYASPLARCQQTAALIAEATGVALQTLPDLIDIDYGDWTWRTHEETARAEPDAYRTWRETPQRMCFPGGESLENLAARASAALGEARARHPQGLIVFVTHDAVARALVISALGLSLGLYHRLEIAPCSLTELATGEAGADLVRLSDTGHLVG